MVDAGWKYWWRSIEVIVATVVVVGVIVALVMLGAVAVIQVRIPATSAPTGRPARSPSSSSCSWPGFCLGYRITAGACAPSARLGCHWNRIHRVGRRSWSAASSITFMVYAAVAGCVSCANLAWIVVGGMLVLAVSDAI